MIKNRLLAGNMIAMFVLAYALLSQQGYAAPSTSTSAVAVGTQFVYEGRLNNVTGTYDLYFRLWDAASGGTLVGSPTSMTVNDRPVAQGEYQAVLNFGPTAFVGEARYLEVRYRLGTSTGAYTVQPGRQPILPVAYALSLRPGAVVTGDVPQPGRAVVRADNTGTGVGLWGSATSNAGVYGQSESGVAVWGRNNYGGIAMKAEGSAVQSASQGGWAKALLRMQGDGTFVGCYNGVTGSSSGKCGFTITSDGNGYYTIDFGSGLDTQSRFFALSGSAAIILTGYPGVTKVQIHVANNTLGYAYYILVY